MPTGVVLTMPSAVDIASATSSLATARPAPNRAHNASARSPARLRSISTMAIRQGPERQQRVRYRGTGAARAELSHAIAADVGKRASKAFRKSRPVGIVTNDARP